MFFSRSISLCAFIFVFSFVSPSHSTHLTWDLISWNSGHFLSQGDSLTYTHDLTAGNTNVHGTPFDPSTQCVTSANLFVKFFDDFSLQYLFTPEKVKVFLDGTLLETRTLPDHFLEIPIFGFEIEHFGVNLAFIQDDGKLDVRLKAKKGDFSVYYSKLIITHEDCGEPVPEPTTLALVGAGVAAMARRRWLA